MAETKKLKDGDFLRAMEHFYDYESVVIGSTGHNQIGNYSDLDKFRPDAEATEAAKQYMKDVDERLKDAKWTEEF